MVERASWAVQQVGGVGQVSVEDARLAQGAVWTPTGRVTSRTGIVPASTTPGQVTATDPTPDGQVHVAAFRAVLQSGRGGGVYTMCLDATKDIDVLGTAPADPSNPRIDLIVWQQSDAYYADADSDMVVRHVVGTPAATPSLPTVDGSPDYITAAEVLVPAGATTITNSDITSYDLPYTVAVGGQVPVRSLAERNALSPFEGQRIYRVDKGWEELWAVGAWRVPAIPLVSTLADITDPAVGSIVLYTADFTLRRWDGSEWVVFTYTSTGGHARYYSTAAQTFPTGVYSPAAFETVLDSTPDVTPDAQFQVWTVQRAGIWHVEAGVRLDGVAGGGQRFLRISDGTGAASYANSSDHTATAGDRSSLATSTRRRFAVGDTISARVYQDSGGDVPMGNFSEENFIALTWDRP